MTRPVRFLMIIVAFLLSPVVYAQTLWTKAEYGMTVEQVKAAFPDAVTASKPSQLYGGAVGLLTLPGIHVAASDFHATFYFAAGKLIQVTLSSDKRSSFEGMLVTFGAVEEILRAKYGAELQRQVSRGVYSSAEASWLAGPVNITLLASGVGANDGLLNIVYQVRISKEVEKL